MNSVALFVDVLAYRFDLGDNIMGLSNAALFIGLGFLSMALFMRLAVAFETY